MKILFLSALILLSGGLAEAQSSFMPGTEITAETVLAGMNFYRSLHGQNPLRLDPRLSAAADGRIQDMEERGYWSHASPDGDGPFLRLRDHGYAHSAAGENLAAGFETAGVLVSGWMESEGHRRNILSPEFSDAGIAIIDGAIGKRAAGKSVVVMFGREVPPPARF